MVLKAVGTQKKINLLFYFQCQIRKYRNEGKKARNAPSVWTQQKSIIELVHDELKLNYRFPHSANRLFGICLCLLHFQWPRNYYCCCFMHQINVNNKKMFIVLYCYFTINFLCCFSSSWSITKYIHAHWKGSITNIRLLSSAHNWEPNSLNFNLNGFCCFLLLLLASFFAVFIQHTEKE